MRQWRAFKRLPRKVQVAWVGFILSLINWPISQLTWAKSEPPTTLALSWLAIVLVCVDIIINTKTLTKDDDDSA